MKSVTFTDSQLKFQQTIEVDGFEENRDIVVVQNDEGAGELAVNDLTSQAMTSVQAGQILFRDGAGATVALTKEMVDKLAALIAL
jgi:hypothetical protein